MRKYLPIGVVLLAALIAFCCGDASADDDEPRMPLLRHDRVGDGMVEVFRDNGHEYLLYSNLNSAAMIHSAGCPGVHR